MKRVFILMLFIGLFVSCDKDECLQEAECIKLTDGTTEKNNQVRLENTFVVVCHNGQNLTINESALQSHLNHGDSEGECESLSDGGLVFADGELVEISCSYNLPFIHVDENGASWLFE
jgi:hypothetical protein